MHDTLRFWLDRGVDGFRMDVIMGIVKREDLADVEGGLVQMADESRYDPPAVHERLRAIRTLLDSYPGDRVSVGEVFILSTAKVAEYYGDNDELHLSFNFPPLFAPWDAAKWRHRIERTEVELGRVDAWPTWVLSNHDNSRHRTRYGGSEARARCRRDAAHAARHDVSLRRRGARARRRGDPRPSGWSTPEDATAAARRSRGRRRRRTGGMAPNHGFPFRRTPTRDRSKHQRRTRHRSCTCTDGCSRPDEAPER